MKTIKKSKEPHCLIEGRVKGWDWENFRSNNCEGYLEVRQRSLEDQGYECAYTGLWLGENTSQTVHLDHFKKKSIFPNLSLVYNNLFAAAKNLPYGSDYKDKQIHGPLTNANAQYCTFWSPLKSDLNDAFWYRQDGFMEPMEQLPEAEKVLAKKTIDMFNLNHQYLQQRRHDLMQLIDSLKDCDEKTIRECIGPSGFSFVVDFEIRKIKCEP